MVLSKQMLRTLTLFRLLSPFAFADVFDTQYFPSKEVQNGSRGLKTKKSKSKPKPNSLIALVHGDAGVIGTSTLRFNMDGSFLFALDMAGLANSSGTAVITGGASCDVGNISEEKFSMGDIFDGIVNTYGVLTDGISKSAFRFNNGYTAEENMGKTVLLYDTGNNIVGCGVLGEVAKMKVLTAEMGIYPGYTGTFAPYGTVTVEFYDDDSFKFSYDLNGLEIDCEGCGIHIHAGLSCATNEEVMGHGWNSVVVQDLWTTAGGAFYSTDSMGRAHGYFNLFNGFGYEENYSHAVVIHMSDGSRVGCGVLM